MLGLDLELCYISVIDLAQPFKSESLDSSDASLGVLLPCIL